MAKDGSLEEAMPTIGVGRASERAPVQRTRVGTTLRRVLLACGILSSLLYATMLVVVPMRWDAYSSASQTVSELSAIGAPTRAPWTSFAILYTLLLAAFGWGVWRSAGASRPLRVVAGSLIVTAVFDPFWPPMHLRGAETSLTDTMHIVFTMVWLLLTLLAIGFGASAFGERFRLYSIATLGIFVVFGALTGMDGPRIAADLPTPRIGIWERVNIGAYLVWIVVLAVTLLRARGGTPSPRDTGTVIVP